MSRASSTFKQRDVAAAIKAVVSAGFDVLRVEVTKDGKIVVVTTKGAVEAPENEWDGAL